MSLKKMVEEARLQLTQKAGAAMQGLAQSSAALGMAEATKRLEEVRERLLSESFRLIIVGRFKNGKSTFLNALLGKLTHPVADLPTDRGPMPVDDLPCTATLTSIHYSSRPWVKMVRMDGQAEEWSLGRYLTEATVKEDDAETQQFFADVREFEVGFPAELCQSGVTLLDSPGLDDVPQRTAITRQAVTGCDAAIVVYRSDPLAGQGEREFASQAVAGTGTRVFTVINRWAGRAVDERLKGFAWNRLVKDLQGEATYSGQDLAGKDVYFIDAVAALRGKLTGDARLVEESGLGAFEKRLGKFLIEERQRTHVQRWVRAADDEAGLVEQQIAQRQAGLRQDQTRLEEAYREIQPKLEAVRVRRAKLPNLFDRYRRECQRELLTSYQEMINRVRQDLPDHLKAHKLQSMSLFSAMQQRKLCDEAMAACGKYVQARIEEWSKNPPGKPGAQRALEPILARFFDDVRDEVARIERAFAEAQFELTGWSPTAGPTGVVGMGERVLAGIAGFLVGDVTSIFSGASGGWRGVAGSAAAQFVTAFGLVAMGVGAPLLIIPAVLAAGVLGGALGGNIGIEDRVKRSVLRAVDQGEDEKGRPITGPGGKAMRGLVHAAEDARPRLDEGITQMFRQLEAEVMQKVNAEIDGEERNIERILQDNKTSTEQKAALMATLEEASGGIAGHRAVLKQAGLDAQVVIP